MDYRGYKLYTHFSLVLRKGLLRKMHVVCSCNRCASVLVFRAEVESLGSAIRSKGAVPQPWPMATHGRTVELLECKLKLLEGEKEELLARTLNAEQSLLALHQQHRVEVDSVRAECERLVISLREQYQDAVGQTHQQCQGLAEQLGRIQRVKEGLHQQLREKEQEVSNHGNYHRLGNSKYLLCCAVQNTVFRVLVIAVIMNTFIVQKHLR